MKKAFFVRKITGLFIFELFSLYGMAHSTMRLFETWSLGENDPVSAIGKPPQIGAALIVKNLRKTYLARENFADWQRMPALDRQPFMRKLLPLRVAKPL